MTGKRSALIVATSEYKDRRLAPLEGPGRDAEALRSVLAHKEIGGFDVRVALNSRVDILRRTLESFFADRARDDLLLVHFSGHGLKDDDGQLYLAAADTEIDRLLSTGVDAAWVNRLMSRCRSEKIALFLDCCFAGAFTSGMAHRVGVDTAGVKDHFNGTGLFVITASDAMQYSFEGGTQVGMPPEPSPFTKALVDGLQSGEADRNEDGDVSINELFDFLEDRVRETSPSQTPTKSAFNQVGDWVIAHSTRAPSVRLLPEDLQKQLKSEDALDRFGALIDLRDLIEGADRRVSEAAVQALQRLAVDDSRRVAATAQRLLEEEAARPRSAGRGSRRHTSGSLARTLALDLDPMALEPDPIEPAAAASTPEPAATMPEAAAIAFEASATSADVAMPSVQPEPASAMPAAYDTGPAVVAPPEPAVVAPPEPAMVAPPEPAVIAASAPPLVAPMTPPPSSWVAPASHEPTGPAPGPVAGWTSYRPRDAAPQVAPAVSRGAQARDESSTDLPWSIGRAASRAAIGSFLWVLLQFMWFLVKNPEVQSSPSDLDAVTNAFSVMLWLIIIGTTAIVAVGERSLPAIRLPGGAFYQFFGGNRWVAAAILGVVTAWTIGLGIEAAYLNYTFGWMLGVGWEMPVCAAVGFLVAEVAVGRRFGGHPRERSTAA